MGEEEERDDRRRGRETGSLILHQLVNPEPLRNFLAKKKTFEKAKTRFSACKMYIKNLSSHTGHGKLKRSSTLYSEPIRNMTRILALRSKLCQLRGENRIRNALRCMNVPFLLPKSMCAIMLIL